MAAGLGGGGASLASQFANAATGGIAPMIGRAWSNAPQRAVNLWQANRPRRAEARAAGGTLYNNSYSQPRHEATCSTNHLRHCRSPPLVAGDHLATPQQAPHTQPVRHGRK